MEKKKSIILQVDESTKQVLSEVENRISSGFSTTLNMLLDELISSTGKIENIKSKLRDIDELRDVLDDSTTQIDNLQKSIDRLITIVASIANMDEDSLTSDDPLKKNATREDINNAVAAYQESIELLSSTLDELIRHVNDDIKSIGTSIDSRMSSMIQNGQKNVTQMCDKLQNVESALKNHITIKGDIIIKSLQELLDKQESLILKLNQDLSQSHIQVSATIKESVENLSSDLNNVNLSLSTAQKQYYDLTNAQILRLEELINNINEANKREIEICKSREEDIYLIVNQILYNSLPFWRFKKRKQLKNLINTKINTNE